MAVSKVFFDVPPLLGIPGLVALAKEKHAKLGEGQFLMFMNRKRTRVKILFTEDTMFVYSKGNQEITLEELKALPDIVKGAWVDASAAKVVARFLSKPITTAGSAVRVAS